ncbi:hypothetical protein SY89_02557 [Halolamina pelagica]|uniref:Uncharacterized protein n=1 Tax=Halolamina pelagica TaxID=699431 RepID=A0A0P7HDR6_9EURY|nr:hypothetical protein SY89_02557 [Halolamina pelagica]
MRWRSSWRSSVMEWAAVANAKLTGRGIEEMLTQTSRPVSRWALIRSYARSNAAS